MAFEGETDRTPQGHGKRQVVGRLCHRFGVLPVLLLLRTLLRTELRILAYHRVRDIDDISNFDFDLALISATPARFRAQMEIVRRRFRPVVFADLIAMLDGGRPLPGNAVVVSFDDGYDDNYRVAFPILRELGIPATFFVSTGHIDSGLPYAYDWLVHMVCLTTAPRIDVPEIELRAALPVSRSGRHALAAEVLDRMKWHDSAVQNAIIRRLEQEWSMPCERHPDCRPMTWVQLREMRAAGMEIGSHGATHSMLARLPAEQMVDEVHGSSATLERELGLRPRTLSYPVGGPNAYSPEVIAAARSAGFRIGCNYVCGTNPLPPPDCYALQRLPVESNMDDGWFSAMLTWPELFSYPSRLRIG